MSDIKIILDQLGFEQDSPERLEAERTLYNRQLDKINALRSRASNPAAEAELNERVMAAAKKYVESKKTPSADGTIVDFASAVSKRASNKTRRAPVRLVLSMSENLEVDAAAFKPNFIGKIGVQRGEVKFYAFDEVVFAKIIQFPGAFVVSDPKFLILEKEEFRIERLEMEEARKQGLYTVHKLTLTLLKHFLSLNKRSRMRINMIWK
ncbi:MAG: hypothetical protein KGZ73_09240 [Rhizobiales bacterium]|nr:hypothetical protein [Hyphomicrobiales bacterium]